MAGNDSCQILTAAIDHSCCSNKALRLSLAFVCFPKGCISFYYDNGPWIMTFWCSAWLQLPACFSSICGRFLLWFSRSMLVVVITPRNKTSLCVRAIETRRRAFDQDAVETSRTTTLRNLNNYPTVWCENEN